MLNDDAEVLALWRRLNVLAETNAHAAAIVNAYRDAHREECKELESSADAE